MVLRRKEEKESEKGGERTWNHVAFEIEKHLCVCPLMTIGEEGWVMREDCFGKQDKCYNEADTGTDCS